LIDWLIDYNSYCDTVCRWGVAYSILIETSRVVRMRGQLSLVRCLSNCQSQSVQSSLSMRHTKYLYLLAEVIRRGLTADPLLVAETAGEIKRCAVTAHSGRWYLPLLGVFVCCSCHASLLLVELKTWLFGDLALLDLFLSYRTDSTDSGTI